MRRRWVVSGVRRVRAVPCVRASSSSSSARRESSRARERLNSLNRARCDAFDAPSREISVWYACGVCVVLCVRASRARVKCVARESVRRESRRAVEFTTTSTLKLHLLRRCALTRGDPIERGVHVVSIDVFERFYRVALAVAEHDEFGDGDGEPNGLLRVGRRLISAYDV